MIKRHLEGELAKVIVHLEGLLPAADDYAACAEEARSDCLKIDDVE